MIFTPQAKLIGGSVVVLAAVWTGSWLQRRWDAPVIEKVRVRAEHAEKLLREYVASDAAKDVTIEHLRTLNEENAASVARLKTEGEALQDRLDRLPAVWLERGRQQERDRARLEAPLGGTCEEQVREACRRIKETL